MGHPQAAGSARAHGISRWCLAVMGAACRQRTTQRRSALFLTWLKESRQQNLTRQLPTGDRLRAWVWAWAGWLIGVTGERDGCPRAARGADWHHAGCDRTGVPD